jgi:hypothetical protein
VAGLALCYDGPVPDEPYRSSYRVEERIRALDDQEAARVRARREAWHAEVRRRQLRQPNELLIGIGISVVSAVVGVVIDNPAVLFASGSMTVMLGGIYVLARRKAREHVGAVQSPWDAVDGEWKMRETRIVARSLVAAASGDEDYTTWLLFEIPNGEWLYLDSVCLPPDDAGPSGERLARADVRLSQLWPLGLFLSARGTGDPIPHHGVSGSSGDDYAAALERGLEWSPPDELDEESAEAPVGPIGRIAESELPGWIREAVGR